MGFTDKMRQLEKVEQETKELIDDLRSELLGEISSQPFAGEVINDGSDGGPIITTIRLSALQMGRNCTAEHHLPLAQRKAVEHALRDCDNRPKLVAAVSRMLDRETVTMSNAEFDNICLNDKTLDIIRRSEVGKYVLSTKEDSNV